MLISRESADLISHEISIVMRRPIFLADDTGEILSSTVALQAGKRADVIRQLKEGKEYVILDHEGHDSYEEICFPIYINDRIMGAIGIISGIDERDDIISHYSGTIQRIAEVRIQRLSRRMSHEEEQGYFERARQIFFESTLFSGMLSEFLNDEEVLFRASLLGIDLTRPRVIVVLGFDTNFSLPSEGAYTAALSQKNIYDFAHYLKKNLADKQQDFCFADEQRVVMLLCTASGKEALEISSRLCEDLERFYSIRVYGGLSSVAKDPDQFQRCYSEAKIACKIAQTTQTKMLLPYNVTSPIFIAQSLPQELKTALVHSVFGDMTPEEIREMRELILTYCKHDGNIEQAAAELHVHRNTLLYRINKIKSATGFNLKSPRDLFVLYLTVLVLRH